MQRIINCYQSCREEALAEILSDENECKVVDLWLKNHPVIASPMLTDLRNRITLTQAPIDQAAVKIERKILAGKELSPDDLRTHIDLIKTHVELKTVSAETLLPLLLDHVSTKDILAILKEAEPLTAVPSSLSRLQVLRLAAIRKELPVPPFARAFMQIVQKEKSDLTNDTQAIKNLEGLTQEEKDAALAHYIERYEVSLAELKLNEDELLRLAPHLRFVYFRNFENIPLAQKFLKNCPNHDVIKINSDKIFEGIKELPRCRELYCSQCYISALPALPLCQTLYCWNCPSLRALPDLPLCQNLDCGNCPLSALPELPLCQKLGCSDCSALSALPELPLCQELDCGKCPVSALPALPLCQELKCYCCPALSALPALPLCQKLNCSHCPLSDLPELPLCQELICSWCFQLKELPALPLCHKLECYWCSDIIIPALPLCRVLCSSGCGFSALPALPLCEELECNSCPALIALPPLPLCKKLECRECTALSTLSALPQCKTLVCYKCPSLSALPPLPSCEQLTCYGCPLTELPEMPWFAIVLTADAGFLSLPFISLNIHIEKFATEPVSLLLQLGDHLLKNMPFPNIYYFEKGSRNEAIDYGGVRRDFVTKLCFNLFNQLKLEDNFPIASDHEETAYRALGALLALCYPVNSTYKTGPLFAPQVYNCLCKPNPGSDEWFLTNYLELVTADTTTFAYIVEPDATDISKYTEEYFSDPQNRAHLNQEILKRAKPRLKAISWMAQEFRKRIPDLTGNVQERIEGVLNPEALKRKLTWEGPWQEFLVNWIDHHPEQLEKFVYAVTGLRTLCSENLKIQVFDRNKDFIPVAHTCIFALELSGNYENQEVFDQKIAYFLENALAGSGFSMA